MYKIMLLSVILTISVIFQAGCKQHIVKIPNILLITIDTVRTDYIGCYGSPDVIIPLYKGEISFLDEQIGEVVRYLKKLDLQRNPYYSCGRSWGKYD